MPPMPIDNDADAAAFNNQDAMTPTGSATTQADAGPLSDEFREFGRQLLRAMRSVAESDELRGLGRQIIDSLRDIGQEVQETLERTRDKDEVRAVGEQARRVGQAVTSGTGTSDVQASLSQALRSLNSELNKVIDQVQTRTARMGEAVDSTAQPSGGAMPRDEGMADEVESSFNGTLQDSGEGVESPKDDLAAAWNEPTQPDTYGGAGLSQAAAPYDQVTEREDNWDDAAMIADKAEAAVHRMDAGTPMSDYAEGLVAEGRAELDAMVDRSSDEVSEAQRRGAFDADT